MLDEHMTDIRRNVQWLTAVIAIRHHREKRTVRPRDRRHPIRDRRGTVHQRRRDRTDHAVRIPER